MFHDSISRDFFLPVALLLCPSLLAARQAEDSLDAKIEAARRTRDEGQLQSLKARFQTRTTGDPTDAQGWYRLALMNGYLVGAYEARRDKKDAIAALDAGIDAVLHSIQLNDKSADAHSLLADLYGRKIPFGGMTAVPKFGPKAKEENKCALALDDKNARVWASLGRQYLMSPKMFGGDTNKAIESFQRSLSFDPQQDETYVWLAKAYEKHGDKTKARDAVQQALQLNPQSPLAKNLSSSLNR